MSFNAQLNSSIYDISSKYMFPLALTASCYFLPKMITNCFPLEDDSLPLAGLRVPVRKYVIETLFPMHEEGIIYTRSRRVVVMENIFISGVLFSIAHIRYGSLLNYKQQPAHLLVLAMTIFAACPIIQIFRTGLGFGIHAISRKFTESPAVADKLRVLAAFIVTSDFKCYFTEKTEEIDSGLDRLEEEWELSKPATIKYDAKQLKILFSLCQRIGQGDQFPVLDQGATGTEVDDFVEHAQGILRGCFDHWYEKYGEDAPGVVLDDGADYTDIPQEHLDNAILNIFVDPITHLPIRFPVTVPNKNGGQITILIGRAL